MKKGILVLLFLSSLLSAGNLYKFNTIKPALYDYNSKYIDEEFLLKERKKLTDIINKLEILKNEMQGLEEQKVIIELLKEMKQKYFINSTDIIEIKTNLNKVIDLKSKKIKININNKPQIFKVK